MKIYTLISMCLDYHSLETLESVGSDLQKLITDRRFQHLPVFSSDEVEREDFETPDEDNMGCSHYYYQEWDV